MDKRRAFLNVIVSISFYVVLLVLNFFNRRCLIEYLGIGVAGLSSLYQSLIGFLTVADLGIGSAITFCMYKPIVEGDTDQVAGLYHLFKKLYYIIGSVIAIAGMILTPFLPYLAKNYSDLNVNMYATFILMMISTVITYFYNAKVSLINAYKDNYITTSINSLAKILCLSLQMAVLVLIQSFVWYLICRIISEIFELFAVEFCARKTKNGILKTPSKINDETRREVSKNIKAMFMHKIGTVLVDTVDSIVISAFIGVVILGKYANYITIMSAMFGMLRMFFIPLTSVIGHMCEVVKKETVKQYFDYIYTFNFVVGILAFLVYYAIIDDLIMVCFGNNLSLCKQVSFVITLNYFIQFMRMDALLFRDATGTFYYDRWKPVVEGICNIVLSILFVLILPEMYNVVGVIVATIITNLMICHVVEPYVLFKYVFKGSAKKYYINNYFHIAIFAVFLVILSKLMVTDHSVWKRLFANGFISVSVSAAAIAGVFILKKDFRCMTNQCLRRALDKYQKTKR